MSQLGHALRLILTALAALALLLALVLAWGLRPALPQLPRSLTTPVALTTLEALALLLAWAAALTYLLALLARALGALAHPTRGSRSVALRRLERALTPTSTLRERARSHPRLAPIRPYILTVGAPATSAEGARPAAASATAAAPPTAEVDRPASPPRSISLLGPLRIQGARQRGRRLRSLTAQLLLYLALHPEGATADELADALLPDEDPEQSRPRLWQSATEARRVLGDAFQRDDDGRYQLDRTGVAIDTDELDRLLALARQAGDPAREANHLQQALALFRGEPLAGTDYPWAEGDLRHLRATYAHLLERAGHARLAAGDLRGALEAAERGLRVDELNEALWRLAMEAETAMGLREAVNQRYEQLSRLLDERLGLEPEKETRARYHELLSQG